MIKNYVSLQPTHLRKSQVVAVRVHHTNGDALWQHLLSSELRTSSQLSRH